MKTKIITSEGKTAKLIWPLLAALVITLFLFYIDEGFYNFKWMLNFGNWIAFLIYVGVIYGVQLLLILPLFRFFPKIILMVEIIVLVILSLFFLAFIFSH